MALNPAAVRVVTSYPTPVVSDIIFYELKDSRVPQYSTPPSYGTAYPDASRYPRHKLVFVTPVDEKGFTKWYYAADRTAAEEETYNYSISYPYAGDTNFPRYTRTYIVPRADYTAVAPGTADPTFTSAVLVGQQMQPLDGEIGSLYVRVTRVYDKIPGTGTGGEGIDQTGGGYEVTRPTQDKDFVRLRWKITLPSSIAHDPTFRSGNLTPCPIPNYTNLKLIDEVISPDEENEESVTVVRVYEGNLTGDTAPAVVPVVTKQRELPGVFPPEKFVLDVTTREEVVRVQTPADVALSGLDVPVDYTLVAAQTKPDGTNSGDRIVTYRTTPTVGALAGKEWDDNLRDYVPYTIEVMSPEDAADLSEADGEEITLTPINRYWTIVTRTTPRETSLGDLSREFQTTMPFTWPAVLQSWSLQSVPVRPEPGADPVYDEMAFTYYLKKAWTGICKATVRIAWTKTQPIFEAIEAMAPTAIEVNWPIGRVSVPACLHEEITFTGTTGTEHPQYGYIALNYTVPETNYTDWPDKLVVDFDVRPYRGGFLTRRVEVHKPY